HYDRDAFLSIAWRCDRLGAELLRHEDELRAWIRRDFQCASQHRLAAACKDAKIRAYALLAFLLTLLADHFRLFERGEGAAHHFIEHWQECIYLFLSVHDFDHHWKIHG